MGADSWPILCARNFEWPVESNLHGTHDLDLAQIVSVLRKRPSNFIRIAATSEFDVVRRRMV